MIVVAVGAGAPYGAVSFIAIVAAMALEFR
jgi:hypothetical protein